MALITKPNTFTAGSVILSADVNSDFDTIYTDHNGNITNANIAASAQIADTKLAQITTAGKVSGAAITGLASVPSGAGVLSVLNGGTGATTLAGGGIPVETTWADWGTTIVGTGNLVGWAATPSPVSIYYKKIGKTVFIDFAIIGISNNTATTFTVPFANQGGVDTYFNYIASDNTGVFVSAKGLLPSSSSTVTFYVDFNSTAWTGSGTKKILGQFWYQTT